MRKTLAVAMAAAAAGGCHASVNGDAGPDATRTYNVGNFRQIEVAGPYDVDVRTGGKPSVAASGSERLIEHTRVEVDGDKLIIRPKRRGGWFSFGWSSHGKARFTITTSELNATTIAGSGDVRIDRVQGAEFKGVVAGSGGIDVANVDVQSLKLSIAGSGGIKGGGKAKAADYNIAGSGSIDGGGIATEQAKITIAGSGDVKAHATVTADVSIMGSGDVNVTGGAKCNVSKAGSGGVHCS